MKSIIFCCLSSVQLLSVSFRVRKSKVCRMVVLSLLFFINISCSVEKKGEKSIDLEFQADFTSKFSELVDDFYFIPIETSEKCLVGKINSIEIVEENILLFDRFNTQSVNCFNFKGEFKRSYGRIGKGVGEFYMPDAFCADKEFVYIADYNQMMIYDLSTGVFLERINTDFSGGTMKCTQNSIGFLGANFNDYLCVSDKRMKKKSSFFPFRKEGIQNIESNDNIQVYNQSYLFRQCFGDTIYSIKDGHKFVYSMFFPQKPKSFYQDYKKQEDYTSFVNRCKDKKYYLVDDFRINKSHNIVNYRRGSEKYIRIENIKTRNSKTLIEGEFINDLYLLKNKHPLACYENYFVYVIYPYELTKFKAEEKLTVDLKSIENLITESHNPILLFVKYSV